MLGLFLRSWLDGLPRGSNKMLRLAPPTGACCAALWLRLRGLAKARPTVSANVQFEGKAPIRVRYVLTFLEGKIASETWQIDPKLAVASSYLLSLTRVPRAVAWSGRRTAHRRASIS